MKATLTIEVPDDFEKGNPKTCPYSKRVQHAWGNKDTYDCHAELTFIRKVRDCNEFNCPLEIQDECNVNEYYADCKTCKRNGYCQERRGSDTCRYEPMGE